jgi:large conductance mechanosensitive channel
MINFLIVAFAVFMLVKLIQRLKNEKPAAPPAPLPSKEELLLTEIRDLLKQKQ